MAEFEQRLQATIEAGDFERLAEMAKPFAEQRGTPEYLSARACSLLGVALAFDRPARADEFFTTAAKNPAEYVRATFWRVECQLFLNNVGRARAIAYELARAHPGSPATRYAQGRIALHVYRRLAVDAIAAREAIESEMTRHLAGCRGPAVHQKKDFDPRFVTLAIDWHLERNDLAELARAHEELLRFRPKSVRLIRTLLCLEVTRLASQLRLLAAASEVLPADEMARWRQRREACALDHADPGYPTLFLGLADLAESTAPAAAELAPGRLFFLQRAAESLPFDDPRLPSTVQRLAGLAARSSRQGTAIAALSMIDKLRELDVPLSLEAGLELRLCLSARDFARAIPLATAALPAGKKNYEWLRATWPVLERSSTAVQREVADALLQLKPDDAVSRLVAMRAYRDAADPLSRFAAVFEGKPFLGTSAEDWARYRELLLAQAEENDALDGTTGGVAKAGKSFDDAVDRWRKVATHDVALWELMALRAIKQANANTTPESVLEALEWVNGAITLGSTHVSLVQSQPKLAAVHARYGEMERAQDVADVRVREAVQQLAARRAREEADARDRAAADGKRAKARLEKLREQASYLSSIRSEQASLTRQLRHGALLNSGHRARMERDLAEAEAILRNLCKTCSGLGVVQGATSAPCQSCGGTGKINRNGPGASAEMQ